MDAHFTQTGLGEVKGAGPTTPILKCYSLSFYSAGCSGQERFTSNHSSMHLKQKETKTCHLL